METKEIVFVVLWAISTIIFFLASVKLAIEEKVKNPDADIFTYGMAAFCSPLLGSLTLFMLVIMGAVYIPVMVLNFLIKKLANKRRAQLKSQAATGE